MSQREPSSTYQIHYLDDAGEPRVVARPTLRQAAITTIALELNAPGTVELYAPTGDLYWPSQPVEVTR